MSAAAVVLSSGADRCARADGCFSKWAPIYAEIGIPTFPLEGKRPLVRGPQRLGCEASLKHAENPKFANAAIGMWCGERTGVTVVDIDEPGEPSLRLALDRFGETKVIAQTHSGKYHLYYRHNGERRSIRLGGDRIDILGGGIVVLPPSLGTKGNYCFVRGGLPDLSARSSLPTIRPGATVAVVERSALASNHDKRRALAKDHGPDVGQRDETLFAACRVFAADAATLLDVVQFALERNAQFKPPLPELEARRKAMQAWKYKEEGRLLVPGGPQSAVVPRVLVDRLAADPFALAFLTFIKAHHPVGREFVLAVTALAAKMKVGTRKITGAIETLIELRVIVRVYTGGRGHGDVSRYMLLPPPKVVR